jgi:crotonobetainyl-CoA:carnitine CoA-transferase CaiB-like acyl-CoA transferase
MDYTMNGRIAESHGNRHTSWAPHNSYRCQGDDRWVAIACTNDAEWEALVEVMGKPAWAFEERFNDSLNRWNNQKELDALIAEWTKERDHYDVFHMLQKAGVPAGPVTDFKEVWEDPHVQQMGFFETVTREWTGTHRYPGMQWKLLGTPNHIRYPTPTLGQHNDYVFGDIMGLSEKQLAELEQKNVIGTTYLEGADQN